MQETENQKTIVGIVVLAALTIAGGALFLARIEKPANDEYTVLSDLPNATGLKTGDQVIMNGSQVGIVLRVEFGRKQGIPASVRMRFSKEAFAALGPDSVAWVEHSAADQKVRIIINPGNPGTLSRFVKIKPIRGVESPL